MRQLETVLRDRGHRVTRPRRAVYGALATATRHLTVEELAERVADEHPGVNVASIYRTLSLFDELGLARETRLGDEAGRWELAHPDEHFHVVCVSCGDVSHHVGALVEEIERHLDEGHGFEVGAVDLVVEGRCADCRE